MNMVWHRWLDIVREMAVTQGLDYDLGQVEPPIARKYAQAVNAAVEVAWKFHAWPACCWVMNSTVLSPEFTCEKGFDVLALYGEDPLKAWEGGTDPLVLPLRETSGRYLIRGTRPDKPYYLIRAAVPRFGINVKDMTTNYAPGALVYDIASGDAWRCVKQNLGVSLPPWREWYEGGVFDASDPFRHRRNGVLWQALDDFDADPALNEPGYGSEFTTYWSNTGIQCEWAPQRIPDFMLQAVLHGARAWLHETPPLPRSALETQMEGWLASAVDDLRYNRKQFFAEGGSLTTL